VRGSEGATVRRCDGQKVLGGEGARGRRCSGEKVRQGRRCDR
jgi:hypothetical protein